MELFTQLMYFIKEWWVIIVAVVGLISTGWKGVNKVTESLRQIKLQLERLNDKLTDFDTDRAKMWDKLEAHDERLDDLKLIASKNSDHISENEKDIENLYREVKRK